MNKEKIKKLKEIRDFVQRNLNEAEDDLCRDKSAKRDTYGNELLIKSCKQQLENIEKEINELKEKNNEG